VTGKEGYVRLAEARFDKVMAKAQLTDAQHDGVEEPVESNWITGREDGAWR
jgi:hypothetical protein